MMICTVQRSLSGYRSMRFKVVGRAQATAAVAVLALAASAVAAPLRAFEAEIQASAATDSASPDAPAATNRSEPAGEPAAPAPLTASEAAPPAPSAIVLPQPPDASVSVTVADRLPGLMAERLADAGAGLLPRLPRKDREALAAFYALGNYQPLWIKDGAWTPAGHALVERLRRAGEDGLDADHYPVPAMRPRPEGDAAAAAVEAELKLSAAAIAYARDARGARIEPSRLSDLITPELALPAADAVLTVLAAAPDAGAALAGYNPPHDGYRALKAKLAEVQSSQTQARLADDIRANMERWRWVPPDMGRRHVWVNVPEYKLRLMKDGRAVHEARVIVGKSETPTPLFSDEMDHAIVNPSWYVPPSIFKNEFNSDPGLAAARGYDVIYGRNGAVTVRQPPGERNALGFVKFMFPNKHAVYLHDTPNRRLFASEKRALSHGCVRLDQPFRFGEFVLGSDWTEARLKSLIGRGERTIRLPEKVPVHLTHFTLLVDEKGELRHIADLYGVNGKVRAALGLSRDATPVAQAPAADKTTSAPPERRRLAQAPARRKPVRPVRFVERAPIPVAQPFFWWFR
jgi:L,D-transpeptidase YcbB